MKIQSAFFLTCISTISLPISATTKAPSILQRAAGSASSIIAGYWVNHTLEDFTPQCLEEQVPALKSKKYTASIAKDMLTAAAVVTCTLVLKTLIWQKFDGIVTGDANDVSAPAWLGQSWETGGAVALGLLTYECLGSSLIPDAYALVKNKVQEFWAKKHTNS